MINQEKRDLGFKGKREYIIDTVADTPLTVFHNLDSYYTIESLSWYNPTLKVQEKVEYRCENTDLYNITITTNKSYTALVLTIIA